MVCVLLPACRADLLLIFGRKRLLHLFLRTSINTTLIFDLLFARPFLLSGLAFVATAWHDDDRSLLKAPLLLFAFLLTISTFLTLLYNRKVFGGRAHSVAVNCHQAASLPQSGASPRGHEPRSIFAQKV